MKTRTQEDPPLFKQGDIVRIIDPNCIYRYYPWIIGFLNVYRDPKHDCRNIGLEWSYQLYRYEIGHGTSIWKEESMLKQSI
jgi:hypothetical protein